MANAQAASTNTRSDPYSQCVDDTIAELKLAGMNNGVVGACSNQAQAIYAKQIVKNADALAKELQKRGFKLITNGTKNHLILADIYASFGIDGKIAEKALDKIGLTLNANSIPNDTLTMFNPSGIRLGTPAITTRGLKEDDMALIADWMKRAIDNHQDDQILNNLRSEVREFALRFPLPSDR